MTPAKVAGSALDALRSASMTRAESAERELLLRQVLPLWGRKLPDETLALVVATTAHVPLAVFRDALIGLAKSEAKLSFDNPIPMILDAYRQHRNDEAAVAQAEKDRAHAAIVAKERSDAAEAARKAAKDLAAKFGATQ